MATDYTAQKKSLEKQIASSKTALVANAPPTQRDITLAKQLADIKARESGAKDVELQKAWYGTTKGETAPVGTAVSKPPKGILQRALSTLAMPLGAVVGTAETVLGKGQSKSLYQNVKKSIEEQHTFGDVLRQYGVGDKTALIGGLALDIALDPINWATMGAEAFIPRIAYGAKAGFKGVEAGAKSVALDILKKPAYLLKYFGGESARLVPKVAGEAVETAVKTAKEVAPEVGRELGVSGAQAAKELSEGAMEITAGTGAKGLRQKVVNAALKAKADYNALTGRTMEGLLSKPSLIGGTRVGDLILSKVNALKGEVMKPGWMQRAGEFFAYDPQRVFQNRLANMAEAANMNQFINKEGGSVWNYSKAQLLKSNIVKQSDLTTRLIEGGDLSSDLNQKLIEMVSQGADMPGWKRSEAARSPGRGVAREP